MRMTGICALALGALIGGYAAQAKSMVDDEGKGWWAVTYTPDGFFATALNQPTEQEAERKSRELAQSLPTTYVYGWRTISYPYTWYKDRPENKYVGLVHCKKHVDIKYAHGIKSDVYQQTSILTHGYSRDEVTAYSNRLITTENGEPIMVNGEYLAFEPWRGECGVAGSFDMNDPESVVRVNPRIP